MPVFEIQTPDGKTYEIDAPDQQTAINSLGMKPSKPSASAPAEWGVMEEALSTVFGDYPKKMNAAGLGLIDSAVNAAQGEGFNYSDNYNKHVSRQRDAQSKYNTEHPYRSAAGTAAGLGLGITSMPTYGSGVMGAAGTGAGYGGIMGLGQDADSWAERLYNTATGAGVGAGIGGAGYLAGKAAGYGMTKLGRAWDSINSPPDVRASTVIANTADDVFGPNNAMSSAKAVNDLGPDGMLVDVLGPKGTALGRQSANIDPGARGILEDALLGRKAGQNQRLVGDMERLAGLKAGSTATVDDMVKAIDTQYAPRLDALYSQAREAGKDMPIKFFDDVLKTQQGKAVYQQAKNAVQARARLKGTPKDVSNLAVIDEMKKIFDSKASAAFQGADKATGGLYADFAKSLRMRADAYMNMQEDPIYAQARQLAQEAYRAKDAVTMGETLGAGRVATNAPELAGKVEPGNRQRMAQGYAAKKADTLLNRGSTDGAMNELATPMGKKAADAALGQGKIDTSISRERLFNKTAKELTGNSTTARQLAEMGLGTGVATYALSGDPLTGGVAGILGALARKGGPALARKISTDAQRKAAPLIAEMLTKQGITLSQTAPKSAGTLERLAGAGTSGKDREKLMKALLMLLTPEAQKNIPHTVREN